MRTEPVLAKLNDLRKDARGEGSVEEKALHHAFCFISYEVGAFAGFVEADEAPTGKKDASPGPVAEAYLAALAGLRAEVEDDPEDMEFIALDRALGFISRIPGDFQSYLNEADEDAE